MGGREHEFAVLTWTNQNIHPVGSENNFLICSAHSLIEIRYVSSGDSSDQEALIYDYVRSFTFSFYTLQGEFPSYVEFLACFRFSFTLYFLSSTHYKGSFRSIGSSCMLYVRFVSFTFLFSLAWFMFEFLCGNGCYCIFNERSAQEG